MDVDAIHKLMTELQQLAQYHEMQRDALPWASGPANASKAAEHNRYASTCYSACIELGKVLREHLTKPE